MPPTGHEGAVETPEQEQSKPEQDNPNKTAANPSQVEAKAFQARIADAEQRAKLNGRQIPGIGKIDNIFTYHPPFGTQPFRYDALRDAARNVGRMIDSACPDSREKSLAITHLQTAIMFANAAIAINEKAPAVPEADVAVKPPSDAPWTPPTDC